MDVVLFDSVDSEPSRVIELEPQRHRSFHYWHVFVPHLVAGQIYGFRAHGPYLPDIGLRFDKGKVLLDPYGLAVVTPTNYDRRSLSVGSAGAAASMKSVVVDTSTYNWEGDLALCRPFSGSVIYEMHVA